MDRRSFLKRIGIGAAAVAVAPSLILPPARAIALAEPNKIFFLPPLKPVTLEDLDFWNSNKTALEIIENYNRVRYSIEGYANPLNNAIEMVGKVVRLKVEGVGPSEYAIVDNVSFHTYTDGPAKIHVDLIGYNEKILEEPPLLYGVTTKRYVRETTPYGYKCFDGLTKDWR